MTNIALIVLDTLRKDAFDKHFDWLPGTRFENAWSTSHWTVPAHGSLFTGKYASEVGIFASHQQFNCDDELLAETLSDAGFRTRMFSANPNISPTFSADRGFDMFRGSWRLEGIEQNILNWDKFIAKTRSMGPERFLLALKEVLFGDYDTIPSLKQGAKLKLRNKKIGENAVDDGALTAHNLVKNTAFDENEFLFMNLMEAHTPYYPPDGYGTGDSVELQGLNATFDEPEDDPDEIRRAYDDCVRYLSDMYANIFNELKSDFDVIITMSDHGELLGEHDAWEHMYGLYPELTNVPLSVYFGENEQTTVQQSVSILDIYQTILGAADIDPPEGTRGRDLTEDLDDREYLVEYHGLHDRNYIALENRGYEDIEFLQTKLNGIATDSYYGFETFDGFEEHGTSPYSSPHDRLSELTGELDYAEVSDSRTDDLSEEVIEQLEDLGYA
ncbi:sulfatase-like hydrolase/transferase [Haladaptatus pallidirubidus]|uniref:Sulfatase n=1 Tax=Haladaptatus pallidirubidus TaxID=1008152 RepID=A0AAV3UCW5_9EURY|nr:sulfatase-like hydrolase/transferase [Haladaptatus pallidirubidus]